VKKLQITRLDTCETCHGTGAIGSPQTCPVCNGSGTIQQAAGKMRSMCLARDAGVRERFERLAGLAEAKAVCGRRKQSR